MNRTKDGTQMDEIKVLQYSDNLNKIREGTQMN